MKNQGGNIVDCCISVLDPSTLFYTGCLFAFRRHILTLSSCNNEDF